MSKKIKSVVRKIIPVTSLFIGSVMSSWVWASAPTAAWVARYSGTGIDKAVAEQVDSDGNVYVTGQSFVGSNKYDYVTVKYDSSGNQLWMADYNNAWMANNVSVSGDDQAIAMAVDGNGNVYVTGTSTGDSTGQDYATVKYNSDGVEQWVRRYDGGEGNNDMPTSIAVDNSGNVYVTGTAFGDLSYKDYATVKYDSNGTEQWVETYNGSGNGNDIAFAIAADNNGNVYVTGYSTGSGTGHDYATIKYDSNGAEQWVARYTGPGTGDDEAAGMALDSDGNIYVTGRSWGDDADDYATIKYNSSGDEVWVERYNGGSTDDATAIVLDDAGNVYVTGESFNLPEEFSGVQSTGFDYVTLKYNNNGDQQWVARYTGPGNGTDYPTAMVVDGAGNVFVTGYSKVSTGNDYATVKFDNSGNQQWVASYDGPSRDDKAMAIVLDNYGNAYVTGSTYVKKGNTDYVTVKYANVAVSNVAPVMGDITVDESVVAVNNTVSLSANFTDANLQDTHTATINWGDGSDAAPDVTPATVTESQGSGSISGNHVYNATGLYTVTVSVTDNHSMTGTGTFSYVVVYDPSAGFVTGGGTIDSPPGAYSADPLLSGKANFGFNAKYKKGQTVPDGDTEFQFKAGNFDFRSTSYDWLVIAGARAQYKGEGSVNGVDGYSFILTAIDGQVSGGGGVDKFRMKVMDQNGGDVYDNMMGATDDADPSTALSSGQIIIHSN